jgi:HPt (histidine-containing phosphotransfer) domain-containing protein
VVCLPGILGPLHSEKYFRHSSEMDHVSPINREKAIESLGDEDIFDSVVASFLEEVEQMMAVLDQAVASADADTIKEKAHWFKGGLVYLHAGPSADAAYQLEMAVALGPDRIKGAYEKLSFEVDRLKAILLGGTSS